MKKRVFVACSAALLIGFALTACGPPAEPDEPLASLAWPEPSTKFTAEYWSEQAHADSEIWRAALDWCAEDARKLLPNCQTVAQVRFIGTLEDAAGRRSDPYDGKGGVQMPPAVQQQLEQSPPNNDPPPRGAEPVP